MEVNDGYFIFCNSAFRKDEGFTIEMEIIRETEKQNLKQIIRILYRNIN